MPTAYTPGLRVNPSTVIEKVRRLPLKGEVVVNEGDRVVSDTVVARTELPGILQTVKLAEQLGVEPGDVPQTLLVQQGDRIEKGMLLARTKGLFGLFKSEVRSPVAGTLEMISDTTGHVGIRQTATPIEKTAYVSGRVARVMPGEGAVIACRGAFVQGIFGVGGERQGDIAVAAADAGEPIVDASLRPDHRGKVVVGGTGVSPTALRKAADLGVAGVVVGAIVDRILIDYLRAALNDPTFDIGVAITGHEPIPFTLVVTEGFGSIRMAERTFQLLRSLEGRAASINGATQIRAGVIRPEVVVPLEGESVDARGGDGGPAGLLAVGSPVRMIREPYFGQLGTVTALPPELIRVESETMVRVLTARLDDGRDVTVPRANVELIETG